MYSKNKRLLTLLPFLGGTIAIAVLINFGTRDSISLKVMPEWSMPATITLVGTFAMILLTGLVKRNGFRSTVTLPVPVQRGIHIGGMVTMGVFMTLALINMSVWNNLNDRQLPNRLIGMAAVYTQKVFFGDYAALHLVWSLYDNAKHLSNKSDMRYYRDQAEFICSITPALEYKGERRANGDVMHEFKNGTMGSLNGVAFYHEDGSLVYFGTDGYIEFQDGLPEFQPIELGEPIRTINILERGGYLIEYRFNGAEQPQVTLNRTNRSLWASLPNKDFIDDMEIYKSFGDGYSYGVYEPDGVFMSVSSTQVGAGLQNNGVEIKVKTAVPEKITRVRRIHHDSTGNTTLMLLNDQFQVFSELEVSANPYKNISPISSQSQLKSIADAMLKDQKFKNWAAGFADTAKVDSVSFYK